MSAPPPEANLTNLGNVTIIVRIFYIYTYPTNLALHPPLLTIFDEALLLLVCGVLPDQAGGPHHPARQLQHAQRPGASGAIHLLYKGSILCLKVWQSKNNSIIQNHFIILGKY